MTDAPIEWDEPQEVTKVRLLVTKPVPVPMSTSDAWGAHTRPATVADLQLACEAAGLTIEKPHRPGPDVVTITCGGCGKRWGLRFEPVCVAFAELMGCDGGYNKHECEGPND